MIVHILILIKNDFSLFSTNFSPSKNTEMHNSWIENWLRLLQRFGIITAVVGLLGKQVSPTKMEVYAIQTLWCNRQHSKNRKKLPEVARQLQTCIPGTVRKLFFFFISYGFTRNIEFISILILQHGSKMFTLFPFLHLAN